MPCKLIAVLSICASISCSEQILPQLLAQIASLDRDHGVSLHGDGEGVNLVLSHDDGSFGENQNPLGLLSPASERAHVIRIVVGSTSAKQSPLFMVNNTRDVVAYFPASIASVWWTFVPPLPLLYSRPPPDTASILPLDSSTLLLI